MKLSVFLGICLSAVAAFAGPYDISEFDAKDAGVPDDHISAEFGGELTTIPANEVTSLQEGRLVVRQKFEDPFGESETSYQLYQGSAGDMSSMTAMTAEGVDYEKLLTAKVYKSRGMDSKQDEEKVYFDGKSVFAPGLTTAIVFIDGSPVTLKGDTEEAPVEEAAAAPVAKKAECDEYDTDCESEDDDEEFHYTTTAPVDNTEADNKDYAANDAANDVGDRFGIADEVRFWSAVGLTALAAASIVMGIYQHMQANKAQNAYDDLSEINDGLLSACGGNTECEEVLVQKGSYKVSGSTWTITDLQDRMASNKKTHDSYATARNIWFGVAGASITGAVVLYVW